MMLLAAGIVEIGLIFKVYDSTNRIAAQYASAWSDCVDFPTGTCLLELSNYSTASAIKNVAPQLVQANVTLQMFEVQMASTTPVVVYAYPTGQAMTSDQTSAAQAAFSSGQTGVIVTVSYTHTLKFFSSIMTPFLGSLLTPTYTVAQLKS